MRAAAVLFLVLPLCAGCPGDLEKQSEIRKLRVLAVRAEPAELILSADAGVPAATLTALAVEPTGAPVSLQFALCTWLGDAPPATLPCPGSEGIDLPDAGVASARLDLADPRIVAFAQQAQLDAGTFDAGGIPESLAEGVTLLVGLTATAPPAQRLDAFATITVRDDTNGPANTNPDLDALTIATARSDFDVDPAVEIPADGTLTVARGAKTHLTPVAAPKPDPTERYGFSFFATRGEIGSLRSTDTTSTGQPAPTWVQWTAPDDPGPVQLWVVVRDGRGGTGWLTRTLTVQ
jgi:hypothetical protein